MLRRIWRVRERRQLGEASHGKDLEVDMEATLELAEEVDLVVIKDLQGWHNLEAGDSLIKEGV